MYAKHYGNWVRAGFDAWSLGIEASIVAGMRLTRIAAGGPQAARETELMITEKIAAAVELQAKLAGAMPGATALGTTRQTVRHYRGKVAANRRRLSR